MNQIDSRTLLRILKRMCSELTNNALRFLLFSNPTVVERLVLEEAYWPKPGLWRKNAQSMVDGYQQDFDEDEFRQAGIDRLLSCCPNKDSSVGTLRDKFKELIEAVFEHYYDYNLTLVQTELHRLLESHHVDPNDIDYIDSLDDLTLIASFLADCAGSKGNSGVQKKEPDKAESPLSPGPKTPEAQCFAPDVPKNSASAGLTLAVLRDMLTAGSVRVLLVPFADDMAFLTALFPVPVMADLKKAFQSGTVSLEDLMEGDCPPQLSAALTASFAMDSGWRFRELVQRCSALLLPPANLAAFHENAGRLFDATADLPPCVRLRHCYQRCSTGGFAGRGLAALALFALLGPDGFTALFPAESDYQKLCR